MCSIFSFPNDLFGCNFSIQGLLNKIPVLFLQIQGVFKEKIIFKDRAVFPRVFQARANYVINATVLTTRKLALQHALFISQFQIAFP